MTATGEAVAVVESLIERLEDGYVLPERAAEAAALLRARLVEGRYNLPLGPEFCRRASGDLLEATGDKHLRLLWHEAPEPSGRGEEQFVADLLEQFRLETRASAEWSGWRCSAGRDSSVIPPAALAGPAIVAAMRLVQDTHALILDLRETRGGSPDGVALLASFLFPDGEAPTTSCRARRGRGASTGRPPAVPGPRYLDRPVYVLTSSTTFSGGEELAYDLQALGRGVVVGEVTRGGAHPRCGLAHRAGRAAASGRSHGQSRHGRQLGERRVQPDVPATAADALEVARQAALVKIADDPALPMPRAARPARP